MIECDISTPRSLVIHPRVQKNSKDHAELKLEEAIGLAFALETDVVMSQIVPVRDIRPGTYFGGGKVEEFCQDIKRHKIGLLIINTALNPLQQRNLERDLKVKVIDRTGLILEIFALRAATREGRLQVELARLEYERSRLVRTWTHLERQRGGQGFLAGPGETQIEADRRMLATKIGRIKNDLEKVRKRRDLQRRKRERAPERVVALVGYTNAGKSSLFNLLTQGGVMAKDMLFATLDTTHRIFPLPGGKPVILSDTVGFISDLPTDLITAFRATLEEVKQADLLVHVRNMADPMTETHREDVLKVLDMLEAGPAHGQDLIEVWNKTDLLDRENYESLTERAHIQRKLAREFKHGGVKTEHAYMTSCLDGRGLDALRDGIETVLSVSDNIIRVKIVPKDFEVRAWLHQRGNVIDETTHKDGACAMEVRLTPEDLGKLRAHYPQIKIHAA